MMTLDEQLADAIPQWTKLLESLKRDIEDDYRCSDDPGDDTPGMCVTIGFTPETEEKDYSWHYQTGDNSFSGGAYLHRNWGVIYLYRDSDVAELVKQAADEIGESAYHEAEYNKE